MYPGVVGVAALPISPWRFCSSGSVVLVATWAPSLLRGRMDGWSSLMGVWPGGVASLLLSPWLVILRAVLLTMSGVSSSIACPGRGAPFVDAKASLFRRATHAATLTGLTSVPYRPVLATQRLLFYSSSPFGLRWCDGEAKNGGGFVSAGSFPGTLLYFLISLGCFLL